MKTTELMIGDYITFAESLNDEKGPLIFQVVALNCPSEGEALMLLKGEKACDEMEIDDEWSGIPITPAILEQNGFVKSERYEVWKIIHDDYEMRITPWRFAVIFLEDGADKEEFSIPRPNFVHELQHALRLCGIKKELVL